MSRPCACVQGVLQPFVRRAGHTPSNLPRTHSCAEPDQLSPGLSRYCDRVFDEAVIEEAGRRLSEAAPQAQVILFGSHARDEAGPRSDLDFLVIEPSVEDVVEESYRLRQALRGMLVAADIIVVSEAEAKAWGNVHGTVIHAALSEGRLLAA
jgi:uncharacterized protein